VPRGDPGREPGDVHFLHVRSPEAEAMPLIITHGWPGSIVEFMEIISPLTDPAGHGGDPADAFHLVVPSIPGFGFSGHTLERGWDVRRVARAWDELMGRLGYRRYGAQGGDWGSAISRELGLVAPEHLVGVHLNMLVATAADEPADLTEGERARLQALRHFRSTGSGYSAIQSTRPQTLAYGLTDSPAGQLAWIIEEFGEWTDNGLPDQAVDGPATGDPVQSPPCPPVSRSSLERSPHRSAALPRCPTISCTGPSSIAAVTSPPWSNQSS